MTEFILGFTVYTLGAIGVLVLGYVAVKYFVNHGIISNNPRKMKSFLNVEQGLNLEPRKAVYVVKAGSQRFLVATTPDNVSFLAELDKDNLPQQPQQRQPQQRQQVQATQQQQPQMQMPKMHPDLEAKLRYVNVVKHFTK